MLYDSIVSEAHFHQKLCLKIELIAPMTLGVKAKKHPVADHVAGRRLLVFYAPKAQRLCSWCASLGSDGGSKKRAAWWPCRGHRRSACTWPAARFRRFFKAACNIRAECRRRSAQLLLMMQKSQHSSATEIISAQVAPLRLYLWESGGGSCREFEKRDAEKRRARSLMTLLLLSAALAHLRQMSEQSPPSAIKIAATWLKI